MLTSRTSLLIAALTFAWTCSAFPLHAAIVTRFYVATNGKDSNPGTEQQPFATLQRARDAVRAKIQSGLKSDVLVLVRGGTYRLTKPLVFGPEDSATAEHSITYSAVMGERPVLSGGIAISGWQTQGDDVWKAEAPGTFRQLYINGRRAVRAREPNGPDDFYRLKSWNEDDKTISVPAEQVTAWKNLSDVEMIVQLIWAESILRLQSCSSDGKLAKLVVRNPERDMIFLRPYPMKQPDQAYHFETAFEFLDAPGEWFF
ncbi:MAG: hypothetical protein ACWGMZ_03100, partial [Thermoguttaceae bacterium]